MFMNTLISWINLADEIVSGGEVLIFNEYNICAGTSNKIVHVYVMHAI